MKKMVLWFVPLFLIFSFIFIVVTPTLVMSDDISNKVLRLHILANSNEKYDQDLKLKVRDNVLDASNDIFRYCNTLDEAIQIASDNIDLLEKVAQDTVNDYGYEYNVRVRVMKEFYNVRDYDDFSLPAGLYNSIKIEIGDGLGKNWWCVMFPSVCLSGCTDDFKDVLTDEELNAIKSNKYIAKFKAMEIIEKIKYKLS